MRNLNQEYQDTDGRKYAYDFDYIHREYIIRCLKPFFAGPSALELGCYHGEFSKQLLNEFAELTIVEGASDLVAVTTNNLKGHPNQNYTIHCDYFERVNVSEQYDAIFLIHTLEHLDNPTEVLKRMKTWLKPTGKIFVVVPNANAASRQIAVNMNLIDHNQAVTEGEFKQWVKKAQKMYAKVDNITSPKVARNRDTTNSINLAGGTAPQ